MSKKLEEFSDFTTERLHKAIDEYAPVVPFLHPSITGVHIKHDLGLIGRTQNGKRTVVHEGVYGIDGNGFLLYLDLDSMYMEVNGERIGMDQSILDGDSIEQHVTNTEEQQDEEGRKFAKASIGGDAETKIKGEFKRAETGGEPISILEVVANLAIQHAESKKEAEKIFYELFSIKEEEPTRRARGKGAAKVAEILSPNDIVTNALFERGPNAIQPAQYFSDEPIEIKTGKDISAEVLIANDFELDEAIEAYRLDAYDRFWFEKVCTIALEGRTEIKGSEILKLAGYKNPYKAGAISTMESAARSVDKMRRTTVTIDTTNERAKYNKSGGRLVRDISRKNIITGTLHLEKYDDGTHDFTLELHTDETGETVSALPLMQYATDKGQILMLPNDNAAFEGPEKIRPTIEQRVMWSYVERRLASKSQSDTIIIETIFKNMDLKDAPKKKKEQLKGQLRKMLKNYKANGRIANFSIKNKGTAREAVAITPLKDSRSRKK